MSDETRPVTNSRVRAALERMGVPQIEDNGTLLFFGVQASCAPTPIMVTVITDGTLLSLQGGLLVTYDVEALPRLHSAIVARQAQMPTVRGLTFVGEFEGGERANVQASVCLPVESGATDEQLDEWVDFAVEEIVHFASAVTKDVEVVEVTEPVPTVDELEAWLNE